MSALANQTFAKMNGIGNEIVVVDLRDKPALVTAEEARAVASPAGVHYDQLMVLQPPRLNGTEAFIRIYNNDGSEVALYRIAGRADRRAAAAFAVGAQHGQSARDLLVDDVNAYDLGRFGPLLENHPIFPERANITLAHIVDRDHITIRTWKRGAGLTKACGSAACATVVGAAEACQTHRHHRAARDAADS